MGPRCPSARKRRCRRTRTRKKRCRRTRTRPIYRTQRERERERERGIDSKSAYRRTCKRRESDRQKKKKKRHERPSTFPALAQGTEGTRLCMGARTRTHARTLTRTRTRTVTGEPQVGISARPSGQSRPRRLYGARLWRAPAPSALHCSSCSRALGRRRQGGG